MRHAISYVASAAVLLWGGTLLLHGSAHAEPSGAEKASSPRRPVTVSGPAAEAEDEGGEKEEKARPAAGRRRPVIVPGTEVNKPPPVPASTAPASGEAKVPEPPVEEPKAPPAPLEFQGVPEIAGREATQRGPVENPAESRTTSRMGNFSYTFTVKPGRPKAGEPVELLWRIQEILHIPDPAFGDRKPIEAIDLHAQIQGPGGTRLYQAHALETPGTFGLHFTPTEAGVYEVQLRRQDGRSGHQLQSKVYVGTEPPARTRARASEGVEELIADPGPDDRSTGAVMAELGRRWMAFERAAGTPGAAEALARLQEQVAKVAGKIPERHQRDASEYEGLARELVQQLASLGADDSADATLDALHRIQTQSCLRCHTRFRYGLAESVASWPSFELKENLDRAGPAIQSAGPRGRAPVIPASSR